MGKLTPEDIDAVLPQTQCGLCGHGGCLPYAKSLLLDNEAIDLCPPGGVEVLRQLGGLLNKDPSPYEASMREKTKPPLLAVIREDECIGCTKCIQACPVDAILGAAKNMHSVISAECTGCELCVPACPVDCIDLVTDHRATKQPDQFRERFMAREARMAKKNIETRPLPLRESTADRSNYVQAALLRANTKKQ